MAHKKVCILTSVHPAFDTRIFHKEAKTLVKAGYDVTLIGQHERDETVAGVKIIAISRPKNRLHRMFGLTLKVFQLAFRQKADIYHFHDAELLPIGVLLKLFIRKRVINDIHEDIPKDILFKNWIPFYPIRYCISKMVALIEIVGSFFFDYVIVAGEDIAEHFPKFYTKFYRLKILKNFPTTEFVYACKDNNQKRLDVITYAGVLSRGRSIKEIVQAMDYIKREAELIMIGRFDTPQFEKEVKEVSGKKVKFIGQIPYMEIPKFLKEAKIGILCFYPVPNNIEAISGRNNKIYEYMAGGLAIIASNFLKWKKVIEEGPFGITVNPKDPREIASAIDYLLDNPELLKRMGENGRRAVEESYNWGIEEKKLLNIYEKLLK